VEIISVLLKCVPLLGIFGVGLYLLLTAIIPSWREPGWRHYRFYGTRRPNLKGDWLVDMGLVKPTKPIAEGDMDVSTAVRFYFILGLTLLAGGVLGLVRIVLSSR
jgi:hypothetical protein